MAGTDQLVEIPHNDWIELRDLFRCDWPNFAYFLLNEFAYYLLWNYAKWIEQQQLLDIQCFSLNGNWRSDGTFALKDGFEIYFYSSADDENNTLLVRLLSRIRWETFSEISMDYLTKYHRAVEKVIDGTPLLTVKSSNLANYYFMAKEEVLALPSPMLDEGFVLKKLQMSDLDYIYEQWPLRNHISYDAGYGLLKRLIMLNESVGLFNETDVLVSWCLSDQTGAHSDLQTIHMHHRKGYGKTVVIELAKRLARAGADSKAYVLNENDKSIKLFESIGFRKIQTLHWVVVNVEQ